MLVVHIASQRNVFNPLPLKRSQLAAILMQEGSMGYLRERWTEAEVLNLPTGEHDYFDRKAGRLLDDGHWRTILAKAVSALANSVHRLMRRALAVAPLQYRSVTVRGNDPGRPIGVVAVGSTNALGAVHQCPLPIDAYLVSTLVNSPKNDDPRCIERIAVDETLL